MYKNWPEICRIKDELLRLLVATTKDAYVLDGLEKGFPKLFSVEETKPRVPASAIREAARVRSREENNSGEYEERDAEFSWNTVLRDFNIPLIFVHGYGAVPNELLQQLVGQRFEAGMKISYRDIPCLVACISEYAGKLHEIITEMPESEFLMLAPAEFIDMDA